MATGRPGVYARMMLSFLSQFGSGTDVWTQVNQPEIFLGTFRTNYEIVCVFQVEKCVTYKIVSCHCHVKAIVYSDREWSWNRERNRKKEEGGKAARILSLVTGFLEKQLSPCLLLILHLFLDLIDSVKSLPLS